MEKDLEWRISKKILIKKVTAKGKKMATKKAMMKVIVKVLVMVLTMGNAQGIPEDTTMLRLTRLHAFIVVVVE